MLFDAAASGLPPHFDKFFDVALKHLDYSTTVVTLLLSAIAYLATKHFLEVPKAARPSLIWVVIPSVFLVIALGLSLWAYGQIEDSLLQNAPEKFGLSWQTGRTLVTGALVLGCIFSAILYAKLSRR